MLSIPAQVQDVDVHSLVGEATPKEFDTSTLIGKPENVAAAITRNAGLLFRVASRDGEQYSRSTDYRPERINAVIVNGRVTAVNGRG